MTVRRLTPPGTHAAFAGCAVGVAAGVAAIAAALDPEIRSWALGLVGAFIAAVFAWAAVRNYRVRVDLDERTMHIHGWFWSRQVPRDKITAVWDPGHIQYTDRRGYSRSVWVSWLLRNGPDDDSTVLGRMQRPAREATAAIQEWAKVNNSL